MQKRIYIILILLALTITACQGSVGGEAATQPVQATSEPTSAAEPTATGVAEDTQAEISARPMKCTVESRSPTPGPTEQSVFPPVTDSDWVRGSDSAKVTIVEYSDFQ